MPRPKFPKIGLEREDKNGSEQCLHTGSGADFLPTLSEQGHVPNAGWPLTFADKLARTSMHDIEPHYRWRDLYVAAEDRRSPFYGREYSEFCLTNLLYNFYLHPQWDAFGSPTLYAKILYADYDEGYTLIELIGEWNDTLHNDIMYLKREIADVMLRHGIYRFVFFCENVLNFHAGDEDYYAEWAEEVREEGGWIVLLNTRPHVSEELTDAHLDNYVHFGEVYNTIPWRTQKPQTVYEMVGALVARSERRLVG